MNRERVPEVVVRAGNILMERGFEGMLDSYDELFTEDFEWSSVVVRTVENRVFRGREGFAEYWRTFSESFGVMRWSDAAYESIGEDRALCSAHVHLEGTGSGVPMEMHPAYVFEVRDGLISWARNVLSMHDAQEFLANA